MKKAEFYLVFSSVFIHKSTDDKMPKTNSTNKSVERKREKIFIIICHLYLPQVYLLTRNTLVVTMNGFIKILGRGFVYNIN